MTRSIAFVFFLMSCCLAGLTQEQPIPSTSTPRWTVLTDPVCPVASFYDPPLPNATKELRVMYFPGAKNAKLKNPRALWLNIGFNDPAANNSAVIPFTAKGDHWEAIAPADKFHAAYAIFSVKDDTGAIDDSAGQFWDVVFCTPTGEKDLNGVRSQAKSYTGASWSARLRRPRDYSKAIWTLETVIGKDQPNLSRSGLLLEDTWNYKVQRDGGDVQAWAKLATELDQFLADHQGNKTVAYAIGSFVVHNERQLPFEFVERTVTALDSQRNDPQYGLRAELEYNRAVYETDLRKRLAAFDRFVASYPDRPLTAFAQQGRFDTLAKLGDVANAEVAFAQYREAMERQKGRVGDANSYIMYLTMAKLYVDKKIKLADALKLIDEAQALKPTFRPIPRPPEVQRQIDAQCALARASAYLALHKGDLALTEVNKALEVRESADSYFVLAQVLAANGDKKKALDAYFEAVLLPSNKDLKYGADLKKFYLTQHFGTVESFDRALEARKAVRFLATKYVPQLVDQAAPAFEFVTLTGEKFDSRTLNAKTVIINFWSPG